MAKSETDGTAEISASIKSIQSTKSNNNQNHQYYGYQHQFNKENRHLFS